MAYRKVRSQGSVPFSWEETPGISKFRSPNCTDNKGQNAIIRPLQKSSSPYEDFITNMKISPPPCSARPPSRSSSIKGLWWRQDDPFTAAMKECTKNIKRYGLPSEGKTCIGSKKLTFSCKESCDVKEGTLVRHRLPSNLPPLPRERKK